MIPVDGEVLSAVAPRFTGAKATRQTQIIAELDPVLAPTLAAYEIDTRLRIAHFLAQTCHESAGYRTTEEFTTGDQYEGREDLGNTEPGDGRRYKGRGLFQLTGRANYRKFGRVLDIDLEGNPVLAAQPPLALRIACEYWKQRDLNAASDRDDLVAITRTQGGGITGLTDRREFLNRAKTELARVDALKVAGAHPDVPAVLARGANGEAVGHIQMLLRSAGFELAVDQDFGAATELAVTVFQRTHGLAVDGIVGPNTRDALEKTQKGRRTRNRGG